MKNLLVIGDSFCLHRGEQFPTSWVTQLGKLTGCNVYGAGIDGRGWWQQHRWYTENIKHLPAPADTAVVWVHTSPHRLPCDNDAKVTVKVLDIKDHTDPKENSPHGKLLNLAKEFYSSPLYVEEFYTWAIVAWWKQLAIDLSSYKKVIHLFGFYDLGISDKDRLNLLNTNSIVIDNPTLGALSRADTLSFNGGVGDQRINHFSDHNNAQLAKFLKETLDTTLPNSVKQITDLSQWEFEDRFFNFKNRAFAYGSFIKDFKK
jgi:hypothetical protein